MLCYLESIVLITEKHQPSAALTQSIAMSVPSRSGVRGSQCVIISGPVFQVWVLSICLLAILGPLEVEAAKGSLRAGVLSRSERMRVM